MPVGIQLVSEAVSRLLPVADWLPVLSAHLDLGALIVQAASRMQQGDGGEVGMPAAAMSETGDLGLLQVVGGEREEERPWPR